MSTALDILRPPLTTRILAHFAQGDQLRSFTEDQRKYGEHILDVDQQHVANCIISGARSGDWDELHQPMLDDDQGIFRVLPSRSPGHRHVYIDKPIKWGDFSRLLKLLAELELVDPKWADLCLKQHCATLRLPVT